MGIRLFTRVLFLAVLAFLFVPDAPRDAAAYELGTGTLTVSLYYGDGKPLYTCVYIYRQRWDDSDSRPQLGKYETFLCLKPWGLEEASVRLQEGTYALYSPSFFGYDFPERWNISVKARETTKFSYTLGRLKVILKDGEGNTLEKYGISIYKQGTDLEGNPAVKESVFYSVKTKEGFASFDVTPGTYAIDANPKLPGYNWPERFNQVVESGKTREFTYTLGRIAVSPKNANGSPAKNAKVSMAYMVDDPPHKIYQGTAFASATTGENGTAVLDVTPGNYILYHSVGENAEQEREGVPAFSGTVTLTNGVTITGFQPPRQNQLTPTIQTPSGQVLAQMRIALKWSLPRDTTQYQLQITPFNNDGPAIDLIRRPEQSFTILAPRIGTGNYVLLPGMTYSWRVRASNATWSAYPGDAGWSPWSEQQTFRTPSPSSAGISFISPPSGVKSGSPVRLQWANTDSSIFYYEVQVSPDFAFGANGPTDTVWHNLVHGGLADSLNSWLTPELQPDTTYYWRVRPRVQGDGLPVSWSRTWSFRTGQQ